MIPDRPEWFDHAACVDAEDPTIFFPQRGETAKPALEFCDRCPVRAQCLEFALATPVSEDFGIWGGANERTRRALRARRRRQTGNAGAA